MTTTSRLPFDPGPVFAAVVSGVLLTLAFPHAQLWPLIFVGFLPLVLVLPGTRPGAAFGYGYLTGLVHCATLLYWIVNVLVIYGGLPWILAIPVFMLLIGTMALFTACFSVGLVLAVEKTGVRVASSLWIILGAVFFTGMEYLKSFFLTGFPWEPLGAALAPALRLVQLADVVGAHGLTFIVVLINMSLAAMVVRLREDGLRRAVYPLAAAVVLPALLWGYGQWRYQLVTTWMEKAEYREAALVQGSIEQDLKWDPANRVNTLNIYSELTERAAAGEPWLIVWPETALPFFYQKDPRVTEWMTELAGRANTPLLFGSPYFEEREGREFFYNRAFLIDARGDVLGYYDKVHLVPFGEYVPLQRLLPFVKKLSEASGNYVPGTAGRVLDLGGEKIGVLICYESIFAALARRQASAGAEYLVVMTNDAWFGRSSAPYQHFAQAVLRAVETRRAVLRAANTGLSGLIMPNGEASTSLDLFERGFDLVRAPRMTRETIYTTVGDIGPRICLGVTVLFFVAVYIRRKRNADRS